MGKTRDNFKKVGDTKGTFQARMGTIKDRNSKDLTEAEEIKKRRQGRQGGGAWGSDVAAEGESPNRIPDEHPSSALSPLLPRETPRPEGVPRQLKKKKKSLQQLNKR